MYNELRKGATTPKRQPKDKEAKRAYMASYMRQYRARQQAERIHAVDTILNPPHTVSKQEQELKLWKERHK